MCEYKKLLDVLDNDGGYGMRDAADAIRELVDDVERLKAEIYNLRLYLKHIEDKDPALIQSIIKDFSGMPGYCPDRQEEKDA